MDDSNRLQLLDLPNELILRIIQCIDDNETLYATCRVNDLFRTYAQPLIGIDYIVTCSEDGQWAITKIGEHPPRAQQITSLAVAYPERVHERGSSFFPAVANMARLENFVIEATDVPPAHRDWATHSGYPNEQEEVARLFHNASLLRPSNERILTQLRSCEIQFLYDDHNLWDLSSAYVIFLHPTLQNLTVSCGGWPYADGGVLKQVENRDILHNLAKHPQSTKLQTLTFEQCDVNLTALKTILGLPKALKHLKIHECRHYHHPSGWATQKRHLYVEALSPLTRTLESLSISLSSVTQGISLYSDAVDWSPFTSLHTIAVSPINILLGKYPKGDLNLKPLTKKLPPKLETIRIWDQTTWSDHGLLSIARYRRQLGIPNLKLIHYEMCSLTRYTDDVSGYPGGRQTLHSLQEQIKWLGKSLRSEGVRLLVESLIRISSHIPPYLYGETRAKKSQMFDAEDFEMESDVEREERWKALDAERHVREF